MEKEIGGHIELQPAWNADGFVFKYVPREEPEEFDMSAFRLPLGLDGADALTFATDPADDPAPVPAGDGIMTLGLEEPVY